MPTSLELSCCEEHEEGHPDSSAQAILEHYRCPSELLQIALRGELSRGSGFFRFGNAVCYGRSSSGTRRRSPNASLYNVERDVQWTDQGIALPFNPTELIQNLRLERYPGSELSRSINLLRRAYYFFRPPIQSLRRQIQRFYARSRQHSSFPNWPVDSSVEEINEAVLLAVLKRSGSETIPFVWFWPRGASACAVMTHDVEAQTGRDLCKNLMDLDDEFGIKASFQIVPEERYQVSSAFLDSIRRRGFEIAVQDLNHDGRLFDKEEEFARRAALINRYARQYSAHGFRAAVLYRRPQWYHFLDLQFDMSIPNSARLDPQPGGCCTVMPYFIGEMLELPVTTIQDYMLLHILKEHSIDLWKTQTELILKKHGLISFIVHPDYITQTAGEPLYRSLLHYLVSLQQTERIWFALPSEVNRWWRKRSQLSVVRHGASWVIQGKGAEEAQLAFASNVKGHLEYEFADTSKN
ncbi:MAG: hypothetical protein DMG62_10095 [Acidobacteria bacterium]|nr:MAG: hypothetical protein DMG62_10095 [Acidobacteriota bacterium]